MGEFMRDFQNILKFDNLEKPVQSHLKSVYSCLSICLLSAAFGGYVHMYTAIMQAGLLTLFGSLGLLLLLGSTSHTPENQMKRLGYLVGFAFCTGMGLGPIMEMVTMIDATIVPTALLATSVIFICFSVSALLSNQRQWLYLGGILFSGMSFLLLLSLANIFIGSKLLFEVNLYVGLALTLGFILYDTQLIVEKRRRGDDDYIWHSVELFIDFVNLFRRIMILLANKEQKKKDRRQ